MTEEIAGKRKPFEVGKPYYSPYREPGEPPKGYRWDIVARHKEKGYPLEWTLQSTEPDVPSIDELPPPGAEINQHAFDVGLIPELRESDD